MFCLLSVFTGSVHDLAQTGVFNSIKICVISQISCLICLPDKSGNFLAFRAEIAQNTVKPGKTGFGMAITARPRPAICVFEPKIPRTFYFKLTEQSSRKKLAVGGFEPEKVQLLYPAPLKPSQNDLALFCGILNYGM